MKRLLFVKIVGLLLCVGCTSLGRKEHPCYEAGKEQSYYTWLYQDSTFLQCDGNLEYPEVMNRQLSVYMPAQRRMTRHLIFKDSLTWDFSANDIKVSNDVYDYITKCWKYDNNLLSSGRFIFELRPYGYKINRSMNFEIQKHTK